jgi:hypothetical protein
MKRFQAVDIVILILAISVASFIVAVNVSMLMHGPGISEMWLKLLNTVLGAIIAVISVFVGSKMQDRRSADQGNKHRRSTDVKPSAD